jgi:hypothetical protein
VTQFRDPSEIDTGRREHLVTCRLERDLRRLPAEVIDEAPLDGV